MNPPALSLPRRLFRSIFSQSLTVAEMPPLRCGSRLSPVQEPQARTVSLVLDHAAQFGHLVESLRSNNADVARDAATALGKLGDRSAVPQLIDVLLDTWRGAHPVTRCAAAIALGRLADRRATRPLVLALADAVPEVGEEAANALGEIADPQSVEPLLQVAADASGRFASSVRRCAVRALGRARSPRATSLLLALSMNRHEDAGVRLAAQTVSV